MGIYNRNTEKEKLIKLIQDGSASFSFDKKSGKNRLLSEIQDMQITLAEQRIKELARTPFVIRHRWAVSMAVLVFTLIASGATASWANISLPGDRLHALDQFQEKIMLAIPLPDTQKANIQASIVAERNAELEKLIVKNQNGIEIKTEAVIESQKSLNMAIDQVLKSQERSASKGNTQRSEKLQQVLERLEALAAEQEKQVESIRENARDEEAKNMLQLHLEEIKKARVRTGIIN